jgi:probable HAF family extracellular repeat protein
MIRVLPSAVLLTASLAAQYPYHLVDLGVLPGASGSIARGLSPDGRRVVGWSGSLPFVWEEGVGMQPLPLLAGFTTASANDVDDLGRVAGTMGNPGFAVRWDPSGAITNLGTIAGGAHSSGFGINASGHVVGYTDTLPTTTLQHGFLWQGGGLIDLTPGSLDTYAFDVNRFDQVAGYGWTSAFRYTPGSGALWLGTAPGFALSAGRALNDAGQVAGSLTSAAGTTQRVGRWTEGTGWQELPGMGDDNHAAGINSFGQMVGAATIPNGHKAFLYTDGIGMQSLSWLVDPAANSFMAYAHSINDRGQISGHRFDNTVAGWRAFRLDPQYVAVYGQGCAGSNGHVPKLLVAGLPQAGQRISILLAEGKPGSIGLLLMSSAAAAVPLGSGCVAYLAAPAIGSATLTLDQVGQARLVLDLPAGLAPGSLYLQYASIDLAAPSGLFAASNGVELRIL